MASIVARSVRENGRPVLLPATFTTASTEESWITGKEISVSGLYFIFLGIAFFMPTRISFSIWFFVVAYAGYRVMGMSYFPVSPPPLVNAGGNVVHSLNACTRTPSSPFPAASLTVP